MTDSTAIAKYYRDEPSGMPPMTDLLTTLGRPPREFIEAIYAVGYNAGVDATAMMISEGTDAAKDFAANNKREFVDQVMDILRPKDGKGFSRYGDTTKRWAHRQKAKSR